MPFIATAFLLLFGVVGLWNALYFSLVMHGVVKPDTRLVPAICRPEDGTCMLVIKMPQARFFFGIPNADLGIAYYAIVLAWTVLSIIMGAPFHQLAIQAIAGFTVLVSLYLAWSLQFVLKTVCPFCYLGHTINLLIALVVWFAV